MVFERLLSCRHVLPCQSIRIPAFFCRPSEAKECLLMMLGMHPNQDDMERWYAVSVKKVYCLSLFCNLLRKQCPEAAQNFAVDALLLENEALCRSMGATETTTEELNRISTTVSERVAALIQAVVNADTRIRAAQLEHEFNRLTYRNSTISNANNATVSNSA